MSLANHVQIQITQDSVGVTRAGFGVPLLISYDSSFSGVSEYASLAEVAVDFSSTSSPEYLAAQGIFSQNPKPSKIKIAKGSNAPTQEYSLAYTVQDSTTYTVTLAGDGVTTETVSFTSDASATDGEIATGLVAAINGVTGKNFTATGAASPLTITADAAADWFSVEIADVNLMTISQTHADPGIAADLAAIKLLDNDWYALYTFYNSNAMVLAAAAWVEADKKIYIAEVNESEALTTAVGNSDTLDDLATLNYTRTAGAYYPSPAAMFGARWMGKCLPEDPGSITWKFKNLSGIGPVTMTSAQRSNLVARNGNSYEDVAGRDITFEGTTADGDYIDVQRGLDWLEDDMTKSVFEVLAAAKKVPYTDAGVAVIEGAMRGSLQRAIRLGILSDDPAPNVEVPKVADIATVDKTARCLPDMKFTGTLQGAIHKVELVGVISV